jgi:hypothetical protein
MEGMSGAERLRRLGRLAAIGGILGLGSCTGPSVVVACEPPTATVYRDGTRFASQAPVVFEAPYYGTLLVDLDTDEPDRFQPLRTSVAVEPALSGWLFGLDLIAELGRWAFGSFDVRTEHRLAPPPKAALDDARMRSLMAVAREAAVAR